MIRRIVLASLLTYTTGLWAADPDFTGTWRLNEKRSDIRSLPLPVPSVLEIEHQGSACKCLGKTNGDPTEVPCSFSVDGKETRGTAAGWTLSSKAKWEGSALLLNTLVHRQDRQHTQMDRWKLSRDGSTLTIRREIVGLHGDLESTLVYERQH